MFDPISRHICKTSHVFRIFDFALFKKKQYHISRNGYLKKQVTHLKKILLKKTVSQFKKPISHFKMIGDAHYTQFVQKKGLIENSKNMGGLCDVSRYTYKSSIK